MGFTLAVRMKRVKLCFLAMSSFVQIVAFGDTNPNVSRFWEEAHHRKGLFEERKILAAAKISQLESTKFMSVAAAGVVNAPVQNAFSIIQKFKDLPKASSNIHQADYDEAKKHLKLHMSTLGYHVKMKLKIEYDDSRPNKSISWTSIEGHFLGMTGEIGLRPDGERRTLVYLSAKHDNPKLFLPDFLMDLGLSMVVQRVAGQMREYIEEVYKK